MPKKKQQTTDVSKLRQRAEDVLKASSIDIGSPGSLSSDDIKTLIHDFQIHQIELEMQNDELKRFQKELDTARTRYFDFFNMAPVGFFSVDEQKRILECNLTAARLLERPQSAFIKQPITQFILKEDQDIYYLHSKQVFKTKIPQGCDLRMLKNDGSALWVHLATIAVGDAGGATVCRIVMSNITERILAEKMLIEQKKLQGVLEMAGAICHELSQPLQVIFGSSEILLMDIESSDPKHKVLKNIEVSIKRMAILLRKVMGITHYKSKPYLKNKIVDIEQASRHEKRSDFQ
ncbi:MAG: PAS domain-containing protein [Desulfobacterales bacterium]|nr:PAS domain-containing protein [Desulfobacterales bacterium]